MLADGTPSKRPQGGGLYAAFVKSNFKQVKAENADLTPAEVLRKLGVMWKRRQGEFGVQDERCAGGGEDRGIQRGRGGAFIEFRVQDERCG
jgi:hypothetical protein